MPYKKKKDYNKFMREYMREYRKAERELLRLARSEFGWKPPRKRKKRKR